MHTLALGVLGSMRIPNCSQLDTKIYSGDYISQQVNRHMCFAVWQWHAIVWSVLVRQTLSAVACIMQSGNDVPFMACAVTHISMNILRCAVW